MEKDPKRTGVKARELPTFPNPMTEDARYCGEPGDMVRKVRDFCVTFWIACPGCGEFAAIGVSTQDRDWKVVGGSVDDVTTLSLSPSLLRYDCGWHGYLKNGVFESC